MIKSFLLAVLILSGCLNYLIAQGDPRQVSEELVEVEGLLISASGLANQGDAEGAIEIYEKLLESDPTNSAAAYSASRLYAKIDEEKSLKLMQQAFRHDENNAYIAEALAEMLSEADRHLQAADLYAGLFKRFQNREDFLLKQSQSLSRGGKPREGLRAIQSYLASGGRLTPYLGQQRFTLAVSMNDPKAAIRALEELMANFPENADYYQELAQFYRRTGDEDSARLIWTRMSERFPDDARAQLGLAGQGKLLEEEESFIIRLEPIFANPSLDIDVKILQLMPIVQEVAKRGDTVLANRVLPLAKTLTELHGDNPKSHAIYADILLQAKRKQEAIAAYKTTLTIDPSVYLVWDQMLEAIDGTGNYPLLLEESENALILFPNQARLYYYNGLALMNTGDFVAAENTLLQGAVLALDNQVMLYDIYEAQAMLHLREAQFDAALSAIEKAINIRPKHGVGLAVKAEIYFRADNVEPATEILNQAIAESPRNPYVLSVEALGQLMNSQVKLAEQSLEIAKKHGGSAFAYWQELSGDVAYLKGEVDQAKTFWLRATELGGASHKLAQKVSLGTYVK